MSIENHAESNKKQQILNVKNDAVLESKRCMSVKFEKSKNFLFAGLSFHSHTTGGSTIRV
jgi:hypothetical protein